MSGLSFSSQGNPPWYWINWYILTALNPLMNCVLSGYHGLQLWKAWRALHRPDLIVIFHCLSLAGFLLQVPAQLWQFGCTLHHDNEPICSQGTTTGDVAFQDVLGAFLNLANFSLNALYAVLGYFARKATFRTHHFHLLRFIVFPFTVFS